MTSSSSSRVKPHEQLSAILLPFTEMSDPRHHGVSMIDHVTLPPNCAGR